MLITLIRNNFKIVFRQKVLVLFMVLLPIILTSLLSSAFKEYLNSDYKIKDITVGYSINNDSELYERFDEIKKQFKDNKITLKETNLKNASDDIKRGTMSSFIEINKGSYVIHRKNELSIEDMVFEGSFSTVVNGIDTKKSLMEYIMNSRVNPGSINSIGSADYTSIKKIAAEKIPSAINYYGITEIILVIWCGMVIGSNLDNAERKCSLKKRIALSNANPFILILGKLIPVILLVSMQVTIAAVVSKILMGVYWGPNILLPISMLLLEIAAAESLGMLISMIIKNPVVSNVIVFVSSFFMGFIGGSFQTYMYNFVSERMVKISPLYYVNRTLVEFATKGSSEYTMTAVVYMTVILVICVLGATILQSKEGVEA